MRVIFLDTEFTSAGELIQLSYLMDDGERCRAKNFYFRASEMDEGSQRVHHLTKEFLDRVGVDRNSVRDEILADFSGATLAAHNLNSDRRVLEMAFGPLPNRWGLCTMYRFARVLKLPGGRPYKFPSLRELTAHYRVTDVLIGSCVREAFLCAAAPHDARWDAMAVRLCVRAAIARGDCRNLFLNTTED